MRGPPGWYERAARQLASGATIVVTAKQLDIAERTLRRHLDAPSGLLRSQVEAARAEQAQGVADELGPLRDKVLALLASAVDQGDLGAAKALLPRLLATPDAPPPEERQVEPEPSVPEAAHEMALALLTLPDIFRAGAVSREALDEVREAARAFLADDLQPRPPLDVEGERVQVVAPEPEQAPAAGGAAILPVRSPLLN